MHDPAAVPRSGPVVPTVVVTGGSRGIGRAIVARALQDGYDVVNLSRRPPEAAMAGETFVAVDLADPGATRDAARELVADRPVLRLVNNAGAVRPALLEEATEDDREAVVAVNLRAPMILMQEMLPGMRAHRFGRVVNIASRALLGKPERSVYGAAKAGLLGMSRTWALETAPYGVTVNVVAPGPIDTGLFRAVNPAGSESTARLVEAIPVRRMGTPEDVAHAVAGFLDERAGFITGQVLYVCGGLTVGVATP